MNKGTAMTQQESEVMIKELSKVFDVVRLLDEETLETGNITDVTDAKGFPCKCYSFWKKRNNCKNCTSRDAFRKKNEQLKLEYLDSNIYQVISKYVEIDGKPCCLEMASRIDGDFMPDGYSKDEILSSVRIHKEKVYIDPVTGVYNKRYYVEKLSKMDNAAALMFADIKNFKRINENFGHQAGDDVLRQVAGVLRDAAAGKGDVLRYSGDDFVTVFFKVTEEELSEIQKEMCRRVEALRFPELPGVQLKLVTAGTSIPGRVEEMLEQVRI